MRCVPTRAWRRSWTKPPSKTKNEQVARQANKLLTMARHLADAGDNEGAARFYQRIIDEYPDSDEAQYVPGPKWPRWTTASS